MQRGWDRMTSMLGSDLRPAFREVFAPWWHEQIARVYGTEGSHLLGHWKPLSENYREWKEKNFGPMPILQLTGRMRKAMTGITSSGAYVTMSRQSMEIGVNGIPYIRAHQYGVPKHKLPARPHFGIKKEWMRTLDGRMRVWLKKHELEFEGKR